MPAAIVPEDLSGDAPTLPELYTQSCAEGAIDIGPNMIRRFIPESGTPARRGARSERQGIWGQRTAINSRAHRPDYGIKSSMKGGKAKAAMWTDGL